MDTKQKTPKKHGKNKNDGNITPTNKENMESDFYCSSTESEWTEWAQLWSKMATINNNDDSWKRVHSVCFNTAKIIEVK